MNHYRIVWTAMDGGLRGFELVQAEDKEQARLKWSSVHGRNRQINAVQEVHENGDLK